MASKTPEGERRTRALMARVRNLPPASQRVMIWTIIEQVVDTELAGLSDGMLLKTTDIEQLLETCEGVARNL